MINEIQQISILIFNKYFIVIYVFFEKTCFLSFSMFLIFIYNILEMFTFLKLKKLIILLPKKQISFLSKFKKFLALKNLKSFLKKTSRLNFENEFYFRSATK